MSRSQIASITELNALEKRVEKNYRRFLKEISTKRFTIGPEGGTVLLSECRIQIPERALEKKTTLTLSLCRDLFEMSPDHIPVSPVIRCQPFVRFQRPVTVTIKTTCAPSLPTDVIPTFVYSSKDGRKEGSTLRSDHQAEFNTRFLNTHVLAISLNENVLFQIISDRCDHFLMRLHVRFIFWDQRMVDSYAKALYDEGFHTFVTSANYITFRYGAAIEMIVKENKRDIPSRKIFTIDPQKFDVNKAFLTSTGMRSAFYKTDFLLYEWVGSTSATWLQKDTKFFRAPWDTKLCPQLFVCYKVIGPEGAFIQILNCRILFPPMTFKELTIVGVAIKSVYNDALKGYCVISPQIECCTRGGILNRSVTISLPVHAMPPDNLVTVVTKQHRNCEWKIINTSSYVRGRRMTFRVSHFSIFKVLARYVPWLNIHLRHNLYFKTSTSQLLGITCLDDAAANETCRSVEDDGFIVFSSLPDRFSQCSDEMMSYLYSCSNPQKSVVQPTGDVVLTRQDFKSSFYAARAFMLQPSPGEDVNVVSLQYFLSTPQREDVEQRIGLEWSQTGTPQYPTKFNTTTLTTNTTSTSSDRYQTLTPESFYQSSGALPTANTTSANTLSTAAGRDIYNNTYNARRDGLWIVLIVLVACLVAVYFTQYKCNYQIPHYPRAQT